MILDLFKLDGKVAVVTGANTGLGQGMAVALAQAGAKVLGVARRSCEDTKNKIEADGGAFAEVIADLSDMASIDVVMKAAIDTYGRVDILVNNAGIIKRQDAIEFTEENWDSVIQVNQKMVFFLSQAFAKQLMKQGEGGKIINVCSMLSYQGGIRVPSYTASIMIDNSVHGICFNAFATYGKNRYIPIIIGMYHVWLNPACSKNNARRIYCATSNGI